MTATLKLAAAEYHEASRARRLAHLEHANTNRLAIARFKRVLKTDSESAIDGLDRAASMLLAGVPDQIAAMTADALLRSIKQFGKTKSRQLLTTAKVSPTTRLRDLTPRERLDLIVALRAKASGYRTEIERLERRAA